MRIVSDDALELDLEYARLTPLTVTTEGDVTHHRLEGRRTRVGDQGCVVKTPGGFYCLRHNLHLGVGKRRHVVAQEIDAAFCGARLIDLQHRLTFKVAMLGTATQYS